MIYTVKQNDFEGTHLVDEDGKIAATISMATPEALALMQAGPELLEAASEVMSLIELHGPSIVPHLLDSDQNAGQRLRDAIAKARGENAEVAA